MRIALVVSAYDPAIGGVERHVRELATGLAATGDDVTVLTHQLDDRTPCVEQRDGVDVRRFPLTVSAANYRFSIALGRFLRGARDQFDVVHVHSYHTLVGLNALLAGVERMVFTPHYHGTGHTWFRAALHRPYRALGRRIMDCCRAVVCVSGTEADQVATDFPAVADRVVVIPNGSRPPRPTAEALRTCLATPQDVVSVGRLEHYKRNDLLLDAFTHIPAPSRLLIIGDGPAREALERRAMTVGLDGRVLLTGRLPDDDLQAVLATAGVVTSMSEHEAFGLSVADGLVAGARVVASDLPAHREVAALGGATATTLVPRGDVCALAGALRSAVVAGRPVRPAQLPTWDDVVSRIRSVYAKAGA